MLTTFRHEFHEIEPRLESRAATQDPRATALRIAGYPNPDGVPPGDVRESCDSEQCVFTITSRGLMDDSVSASQVRVEFEQTADGWVVQWAGARWRCQPGRGNPFVLGWQTAKCS